jgi:hypothetical protein
LTLNVSGTLTAGTITAVVTVNKISSGKGVEVATVQPIVNMSTAKLAPGATGIVITGLGFDPNHAQNQVIFNDGAVGIVTACTSTSLTVVFLVKPQKPGPLTATVITRHVSSIPNVQVATV